MILIKEQESFTHWIKIISKFVSQDFFDLLDSINCKLFSFKRQQWVTFILLLTFHPVSPIILIVSLICCVAQLWKEGLFERVEINTT